MNDRHDPGAIGVAQAAGRIARGEMTCVEYAQSLLDAIDRTRPLNAWLHVDPERLVKAAALADRQQGRRGPLHGVPLAFKDNIDTADMPTTAGSRVFRGHVPQTHAGVVRRLLDAGALVLGKTNLHELALGVTNDNAAYGPTRNPHADDRIAGGSSGGAAAAVCAGAAPAAIGTDTGGSIRIPAALCGTVGYRPSTGRWPGNGIIPISKTRDTPGPIARSVLDCALLDSVVTGRASDGAAAAKRMLHEGAFSPEARSVRGLRLGVPRRHFWFPLDAGLAEVAGETLDRLRASGASIVECDVDDVAALTAATGMTIAGYETIPGLRAYAAQHGLELDAKDLVSRIDSADVRAAFEWLVGAGAPTDADYQRAMRGFRPALQRAWRRCFELHRIDALVFPTTPIAAARFGEELVRIGDEHVPIFFAYIRNTEPGTVVGAPGLTIPFGRTAAGLPIGMALDGLPGEDEKVLDIALAIEQWWSQDDGDHH